MTKEKLVPMTTEEEDRNADVVRDSNGNVISEKKEVNFALMIELQQKEIKDLISDNTILLEEVKRLVKKINEMNKPKLEN
jgi:hypothetical protein|tara:strand:+ start:771 stop:1010 length:240 start_codon:yes stop_codon:yes gene_type:complete